MASRLSDTRLFYLTAIGLALGSAACSGDTAPRTGGESWIPASRRLEVFQARFPSASVHSGGKAVSRITGESLATGASPLAASDAFKQGLAGALGLSPEDLAQASGQAARAGSPSGIGLMVDKKTKQPKFWLFRYQQSKDGMAVFRSGLRTLVRNDTNTVVWASSTVRGLAQFSPARTMQARAPDLEKSVRALGGLHDLKGQALPAPERLVNASKPELVIFAGTEDEDVAPRMAIEYTAEAEPAGRWRFVADADTGEVLFSESEIAFVAVTGTVRGKVTQGDVAMECAPEVSVPFASAEVDGPSSTSTFTDASGAYSLTTSATGPITVTSLMGGQRFDVVNSNGAADTLTSLVTPPAVANFVHDSAASDVQVISQANAYAHTNEIRSFVLEYVPTYPTIQAETNFPVLVNRTGSYCPGNAWYDPSLRNLNLCLGSTQYTNTSFASVTHHEYGHHVVNMGGSGQGAYGEGMADAIAVLFSGDHQVGLGFFLNDCTAPLRDAENDCQYSPTSCSSCGSEIHDCGNLLAGIVWSIRKNMATAYPNDYVDIINGLTLSSIPMHSGALIDSQMLEDFLTLDDDDQNLGNGTPHHTEICNGFSEHGIACPAINMEVTPGTGFSAGGPVGGPVSPGQTVYTVKNIGQSPSLTYQVALLAPTPWLTLSNATGQLSVGQTAQVTVTIDAAAAAALSPGTYDATLQFTNTTGGVGSTIRAVHLGIVEPGIAYYDPILKAPRCLAASASCDSQALLNGRDGKGPEPNAPNTINDSCQDGTSGTYHFDESIDRLKVFTLDGTNLAPGKAARLEATVYAYSTAVDHLDLYLTTNAIAPAIAWTALTAAPIEPTTTGVTVIALDFTLPTAPAGVWAIRGNFRFGGSASVCSPGAWDDHDDLAFAVDTGGSTDGGAPMDAESHADTSAPIDTSIPNQPPAVSAGGDSTVTLPEAASLVGTVEDDGLPNPPHLVTVVWSQVDGTGTVLFDSPNTVSTHAIFSDAGVYTLRLTADDGEATSSDDVVVTVLPPAPQEQPPVVNAGADLTITLPAAADLMGTVEDDGLPTPPALTITWTKVDGPGAVNFDNPNAAATTANFVQEGAYTLRLTASDGLLSSYDEVVVTVNPALPPPPPQNLPPLVNAGVDMTITLPDPANLVGTVTDDGLPTPPTLTSTWTKVDGPGTVTFANPNTAATTASFSVDGVYTLRLTVSDGELTGSDDVVVTVNPAGTPPPPPPVNQAPVVNAGSDMTVTLPLTASLSGTVTDDNLPTPPALTITWTKVDGPGTVTFTDASAAATTASFSIDGVYTLRLAGSDGALTSSDDVMVTVNPPAPPPPVNQAPTVNAGGDSTITLPATASLSGAVTDDGLPNPPQVVTVTWTKESGPGTVTFNDPNAAVTSASFSEVGVYTLKLTASDSLLSSSDTVVVTVLPAPPVNHEPVVEAGDDKTISIASTAQLTGTVTDDGLPNPPARVTTAWSKLAGPGSVTFGSPTAPTTSARFAKAGTYAIRLTANDGALAASDDVIVIVKPLPPTPAPTNRPPVVDAGPDQTVTLPAVAKLAGTVTDDGLPLSPGKVTVTWTKLSGYGVVTFDNPTSKVSNAAFSQAGTYTLSLTASDGEYSVSDFIVVAVNAADENPAPDAGALPDAAVAADAQSVPGGGDDAVSAIDGIIEPPSGPIIPNPGAPEPRPIIIGFDDAAQPSPDVKLEDAGANVVPADAGLASPDAMAQSLPDARGSAVDLGAASTPNPGTATPMVGIDAGTWDAGTSSQAQNKKDGCSCTLGSGKRQGPELALAFILLGLGILRRRSRKHSCK